MADKNLEEQCRTQEILEERLYSLAEYGLSMSWAGAWFAGNCYLINEIIKNDYNKHPLAAFIPIIGVSALFAGQYALRGANNISRGFIDTLLHGRKRRS